MTKPKPLTPIGRIDQVAKRDGLYRLVIIPEHGKRFFADLAEPPETKFRKGQTVTVTGSKRSEGTETIWLESCAGSATKVGRSK